MSKLFVNTMNPVSGDYIDISGSVRVTDTTVTGTLNARAKDVVVSSNTITWEMSRCYNHYWATCSSHG